jgi:hypothetical protein
MKEIKEMKGIGNERNEKNEKPMCTLCAYVPMWLNYESSKTPSPAIWSIQQYCSARSS